LTAHGAILGTFQYMAPEQVEGREADVRADIFAFGALLYEMATGRRAFEGPTQASLIAAILERDPAPLATLEPAMPPALDHVIRRALAKKPDDRWQSVRDVAAELEWIAGHATAPTSTSALVPGPRRRGAWLLPALAGLVAGAAVTGVLAWTLAGPTRSPMPVRTVVPLPSGAMFGVWAPAVAISPDGRHIVYTALQDGQPTLFLRQLDRFEPELVRGTAGARGPFFSRDGQQIGFFSTDGKLKRVTVGGSAPVVICDAADVRGATWLPDDTIVFAPTVDSGLVRVPAGGGTPQVLTTRDGAKRERTHRFPQAVPGGKAVVFMIGTSDISTYADARIAVQRLDGGAPEVIVEGGSSPRLAAGHLFYSRGNVLMAAPFDESRLQLTGAEFPVADGVAFRSAFGVTDYDVAADGTLIYAPGGEMQPTTRLLWFDRGGRSAPLDETPRFVLQVLLSPDARRLLMYDQRANDALWVRDLQRGTSTRLTTQGRIIDSIIGGSWMRDGQRVVYGINNGMAWVPSDGSGAEEILYRDPALASIVITPTASADGDAVFFTTVQPGTGADIWKFSLASRKATSWLASRAHEGAARPSPDGSLVAYNSDETGRLEVFVRGSSGGTRVQVSAAGGSTPVWSRQGHELFFLSGRDLYSVAVRSRQPLRLGIPQRLFEGQAMWIGGAVTPWISGTYDVMPDGRFVFIDAKPEARPQELRLVQGALGSGVR
jgi:serine/threonine-protein kinase